MKPSLIEQYETICNQIVQEFGKKQGHDFDWWVSDIVGGAASFNSYYILSFDDILLDMRSKQPSGQIFEWIDEGSDYNILKDNYDDYKTINYASYIKGMRYEDLK